MLEMKEVTYSYRTKKRIVPVLRKRSFRFEKGKMYALFGPSGSGKTTCLSLLGGLEEPDFGKVLLDGTDIKEIGQEKLRREHVSYIFQDYQLFPYMTALENVMVAERISHGKSKKSAMKERCSGFLAQLGLTQAEMNRRVTGLSGGQQQRVAIARALVTDAEYILADEPTGNLDKDNAAKIVEILEGIAHEQDRCVIIVTHSEYVKKQCDTVYKMGD